ncbi:MAG: hypothetical protein ACK4L8_08650 [Nitrincola lacisaponensis]|uniref:hypothetical protein n=1 Tax=Nitrincola lacisaponensis TaxID=267850 RepID=UPI00391DD1FC
MNRWFDPNESFFELLIVKITFIFFISFSVLFSAVITLNSDLNVDLSYNGFNYFVVVYKVPLATLALLIPSVAVLAANHRSEQTREQIKIASNQNNFINYYKHLEEFEKYYNQHTVKFVKFKSLNHLYGCIFSKVKYGRYSVDGTVLFFLNGIIDKFLCVAKKLGDADDKQRFHCLFSMYQMRNRLYDYFSADFTSGATSVSCSYEKYQLILPAGNIGYLVRIFCDMIEQLHLIFQFDGSFVSFDNFDQLMKLKECSFPKKYNPEKENAWEELNIAPLLKHEPTP